MSLTLARQTDQANVRPSEGSGTTTLVSTDNRSQLFNLSAARTCLLPSTGILKGEAILLSNRTDFTLTIQASDASSVDRINVGRAQLVALQDGPTASSHWAVLDIEDTGSYTPSVNTVTNASVGAPNTAWHYTRVNFGVHFCGVLDNGVTPSNGTPAFSFTLPIGRGTNFPSRNYGNCWGVDTGSNTPDTYWSGNAVTTTTNNMRIQSRMSVTPGNQDVNIAGFYRLN